jgi:adenosine/AMP kinase
VDITTVSIEKSETMGIILGQSHFIKTVEDIHEAMVGSVPFVRFGLAFCEASGDRLVRVSGTDDDLTALAAKNALAIGAGHTFVLLLGEGVFPINVLNSIKMVPEVCRVFCATANPLEVIVAETEQGRGVLGVIDGAAPLGVEDEEHIAARKGLLRTFGYKL